MCLLLHIDNGPAGSRRTGTATVFVEVQDVNDNRPIFLQNSYETSILESVPQGTSILQVENTNTAANSKKTALSAVKKLNVTLFLNVTITKNQSQRGLFLVQVALTVLVTHRVLRPA